METREEEILNSATFSGPFTSGKQLLVRLTVQTLTHINSEALNWSPAV